MASNKKLFVHPSAERDTASCPLCDGPNDCQLCAPATRKSPCWCASVEIPGELLARVPGALQNRACICRACVAAFHRERASAPETPAAPGDYYLDDRGRTVFTEAYHLRRGYCCDNDCRHCPYQRANE